MKKRRSKKKKGPRHFSGMKAKKHLGQHFLTDLNIAERIAGSLSLETTKNVIEIGPGMGVLTQFLLEKPIDLLAMEIDLESVDFLMAKEEFQLKKANFTLKHDDFLKQDLSAVFKGEEFLIVGNFPYNISSQILFKAIENRGRVPELCGMFQKEVAQRICAGPGSKTYGILSVLTQAFYETRYLFSVPPEVFRPPPKVESGVLQLKRKEELELKCDEILFFKLVKMAFQQRRKTMRNSLKRMNLSDEIRKESIFGKRPEQLEVDEFIDLTLKIEEDGI